MAYYMTVRGKSVHFPEVCSICCGSGPFVEMERSFTQAKGFYVVAYGTQTTTLSYPTCPKCVRRSLRMLILAWVLMVAPWGFVCMSPSFSDNRDTTATIAQVAAVIAMVGVVSGIALLFYRGRVQGNLQLAYTGRDELVFKSNRRDYAEVFAAANDATVEKKAFYLRIS